MTPLDKQEFLHLKAYINYVLIETYYVQLRKNGTCAVEDIANKKQTRTPETEK